MEGFDRFDHVAILYASDLPWKNLFDFLFVQDTYFKRAEKKSRKTPTD
jgi:hypothetical protein